MKGLIAVLILSWLGFGVTAAQAATVAAADAGVVQATLTGELAVIDKAIFQAGGSMIDFRKTNIFWVLGGGLVALSLVARRISA